jgi:hypothetical protein
LGAERVDGDVRELGPLDLLVADRTRTVEPSDRGTRSAALAVGGDHDDVMAVVHERLRQRSKTRGFHPVVVGDEDPHARTVAGLLEGSVASG